MSLALLMLSAGATRQFLGTDATGARESAAEWRQLTMSAQRSSEGALIFEDATPTSGIEFIHDADRDGAYRLPEEMAIERGDASAALERVDEALSRIGGDFVAYQIRARALAALGRAEEATKNAAHAGSLPHYRGWLTFDARLQEAHAAAATHRWLENSYNAALARRDLSAVARISDELAERIPGDAEGWRRAANARADTGDVPGARERLSRALAIEPNSAPVLCSAAEIEMTARDLEAAARFAARARTASPDDAFAEQVSARISTLRGRMREAVEHARRAVALAPRERQHTAVLMQVLERRGDTAGALDAVIADLARVPGDGWAERESDRLRGRLSQLPR